MESVGDSVMIEGYTGMDIVLLGLGALMLGMFLMIVCGAL